MSYPILLLILSMLVIVPTVFVMRKKSQQKHLPNYQKQPKLISNSSTDKAQQSLQQLKIAETISHYRNHPELPISFRQLLAKIHSQYQYLNTTKLAPDQRFTVDKLAGTRLVEILDDYLTLDKDYAESTIIDHENNLTSTDLSYGQLTSILEFMQRVQNDGQAQVASNILANRSYLQSVYSDFHQADATQKTLKELKAPSQDLSNDKDITTEALMIERGIEYLQDCDSAQPHELALSNHTSLLGDDLLTQLGQLITTAELSITYSEALLATAQPLPAFDKILASALPRLLRNTITQQQKQEGQSQQQPMLATAAHTNENMPTSDKVINQNQAHGKLSASQLELLTQKISRIQQLFDECFNKLEKAAQQQSESGTATIDNKGLQNTLKSKHSQAQYLLDSGFFD